MNPEPYMRLTWTAAGVIVAAAVAIGGGLGLFVRLTIKAEFADLLQKLQEHYVPTKTCMALHAETERRLSVLEPKTQH